MYEPKLVEGVHRSSCSTSSTSPISAGARVKREPLAEFSQSSVHLKSNQTFSNQTWLDKNSIVKISKSGNVKKEASEPEKSYGLEDLSKKLPDRREIKNLKGKSNQNWLVSDRSVSDTFAMSRKIRNNEMILRSATKDVSAVPVTLDKNTMGLVMLKPRRAGSRAISELRRGDVSEEITEACKVSMYVSSMSVEEATFCTKVVRSKDHAAKKEMKEDSRYKNGKKKMLQWRSVVKHVNATLGL